MSEEPGRGYWRPSDPAEGSRDGDAHGARPSPESPAEGEDEDEERKRIERPPGEEQERNDGRPGEDGGGGVGR